MRGLMPPAGRTRAALAMVVLLLAAAAWAAAGCTARQPQVVEQPETSPGAPSAPATQAPSAPSSPTTGAVSVKDLTVELVKIADGFEAPVYVTGAGDGTRRFFIVEQPGRIKLRTFQSSHGPKGQLPGPRLGPDETVFLDITSEVSYGGERGLLGLAFAPDFKTSGRFFVDYTRNPDGATVIAEGSAKPGEQKASPKLKTLLVIEQPYANHNGGCLQFGPDGMLYIGMGDGGSAGDPQNRAQNPDERLGKLLRIDVNAGGSAGYAPAKGNPYASGSKGDPLVWALGLRNPWRFSFDRERGDLWIGDVGQNAWEEVDVVSAQQAGVDYGWRLYEGTHPFDPADPPAPKKGLTFPIVEYDHSAGNSVTGGYVYRGSDFPAMDGVYLYADFGSGRLWGLRRLHGAGVPATNRQLLETGLAVSSFGEDDRGELYVVDYGGAIYRVVGRGPR